MKWYIPTFHGDIRLEAIDAKRCKLIAERLTAREQDAMSTLQVMVVKKKWADELKIKGSTELAAPLDKVARALAKVLKPGRKIVSAVKFSDGRMEEVTRATFAEHAAVDRAVDESMTPYREPAEVMPVPAPVPPVAVASVAKPVLGCPPPDFPPAEVKAREVLVQFLSSEQVEDFQRHNRFISVGATSGHRYMITSRYARDHLAHYHRSLYDLEEGRPYCVHDWMVPPAEEMLALHLLLRVGHENYLRRVEG